MVASQMTLFDEPITRAEQEQRESKVRSRSAVEEQRFAKRCGLSVRRVGDCVVIRSQGKAIAELTRDEAAFFAAWVTEKTAFKVKEDEEWG